MPKKILATTTIIALAIAMLSAIPLLKANFIPTEPISYIYIRSDGSVEPATPLITAISSVYTLKGDFTNTSIVIERDGITLDGAGYTITGHSTSYGKGVDLTNKTEVTIKNLVINQFGTGILMDHASKNTLIGNKMTTFSAFHMINADDNNITDNVSTQGYGIYGSGSNNFIMNNSFSGGLSGGGNGMGIYLGGNYNTISSNIIIHGVSINMGNSQYNTISYNTMLNGHAGILLARSSNNLVFGNTLKGITNEGVSAGYALYISDSSTNNTIFDNTFENNVLAASLGAQVADIVWNNVTNNVLIRNNFINNTQNVWIAPGAPVNFWDNGSQGNYWSNFHGVDSNADGISESPYVINANNTDYHPFINPIVFSIQEIPLTFPTLIPTSTSAPTSNPTEHSIPSAAPTSNPTEHSTPNPSPTLNTAEETNPSPLPKLPEFPVWIIVTFAVLFAVVLVYLNRKRLLQYPPLKKEINKTLITISTHVFSFVY
jgi:parallel beta-helix repeat protein